jgi:glyoxylase-like metal-dependent hydrolase (beta-lactamase superfamily II)
MQLSSIPGNVQWLDGGAMYGNAPRPVWERWSPPDARNRIELACRAMLVRDGGKNVLCEAGIGTFFDPKLRDRFGVTEERHVLLDSLRTVGLAHEQIDVVVLSHLHFDHAGGLLSSFADGKKLLFPKATFVVSRPHWERAKDPHPRDRASFIPELNEQLEASGRMELVSPGPDGIGRSITLDQLGTGWSFTFSDGHTPGLMITTVETPRGPVSFPADLIPGVPWVHLPITMGYDRFPERLIEEKRALIERVRKTNGWLFFTHDPRISCARVGEEKGKFVATEVEEEMRWT